jgi:predicted  nucleic acid-binding Zn ribbon protein
VIISNLELMEVVSENEIVEGGALGTLRDINVVVVPQINVGVIVDAIDIAGDDLNSKNTIAQANFVELDD